MVAAPVGVAAVAVVGGAVAVEGDAHLDVELVEQVEVTGAQLEAVGVDAEIQFGDAREGRGELLADAAQSDRSCQQWLPSVQDH